MIKSLVSFSYLDLIFKVTMRHKLKYLRKIMTSVPNLLNQTVNCIWIYTNIFYGQDNELIGDLDLFASVVAEILLIQFLIPLPHNLNFNLKDKNIHLLIFYSPIYNTF